MNLKDKEDKIKELLSEMSYEKVKLNGFTDLYVEGSFTSKHQEEIERWGSIDGFKTIITENIDKTSLLTFKERLNNICLEKTFIKDGILNITYENNRNANINIEFISGIFAMKNGDSHVY